MRAPECSSSAAQIPLSPALPCSPRARTSSTAFTGRVPSPGRAGHWAGLANCYYWIDRATGVAGAFLTQVLPFFDARIVETVAGFEMGVYAEVGAPAHMLGVDEAAAAAEPALPPARARP